MPPTSNDRLARTADLMVRAGRSLSYGGLYTIIEGQCPGTFPHFAARAQGCRIEDSTGNSFVDWFLGWGPAMLGHCHPEVDAAVTEQLAKGANPSLMHPLEVEVAERIIEMVPCAERVAFGKNGSDATAFAVRLARAVTGRELILSCAVTPGNEYDGQAAPDLKADIDRQRRRISGLYVDLGYRHSPVIDELIEQGAEVISKPWPTSNSRGTGCFSKSEFKLNMRNRTITCPAGHTEPFQLGEMVRFDPDLCDGCSLRSKCTTAARNRGRTVSIAKDEFLQQRLRKSLKTRAGRQKLRRRTGIEHSLAHVARKKGARARYRGCRKNLFDLRRTASVINSRRS